MGGAGLCPPESTVLEFVQGRLGREEVDRLERHLDLCAACRRLVAALALGGEEIGSRAAPSTARGVPPAGETATVSEAPVAPAPMPPVAASWPVGAVLASRFRVLQRLGMGGMGTAYEAEDLELRQRVALKVLHADLGLTEALRERVRREIVVGRRVSHPNVVRIYDLGLAGDAIFFTMELLEGETLAARLARGPFEPGEAVTLLLQVVAALEASHAKGVVHRDIKPANVMVGPDGHATVMDFGLALDDEAATVERRAAAGTPGYWAPEQAAGEGATAQSDLFSVGLVAFELIAGHRRPAWWTGELDELPAALRPVVARCLEVRPEERFASAAELRRALVEARERLGRGEAPACLGGAEPESFVGRKAELDRLGRLFAAGARLVTLVGPPGIGKSRLAGRFVELSGGGRPVVACDLGAARALAQICGDLARALDLPLGGEETDPDPVGRLGRALDAAGEPLVLLDAMDRVVRFAPATVGRWLELAPRARFLVTSRERLRLPGERPFELPPLGLPREGSRAGASTPLLEAEAVQLFLERARAARPELALGDEDLAAVGRIVLRLDGVPLAIELAAARVGLMSPTELDGRLADRLDLIEGPAGGAPGQRSSLRDAIEWSLELLGPAERAVLAGCSVFASPFTCGAAEAVVGAVGGLSPSALLDVLASLRDKSLLAAAEAREGREPRLRLLGSVREQVGGALDPATATALGQRHGEHFVAEAERLAAEIDGPRGPAAAAELAAIGDELLGALEAAEAAALGGLALRAALPLDAILGRVGPPDLHLGVLSRALALAPSGHELRPAVLARRGAARVAQGDLEGGARDLGEARRLAAARGDDETAVRCLLAQSRRAFLAGALHEAVGHGRDARDRALGRFPLLAGRALARMAASLAEQGAVDEAALRGQQALALARDRRDRVLEGEALTVLGRVAMIRGDLEAANATYGEALAIYEALRERRAAAQTLERLALVAEEGDRLEQAKALGERALDEARQVGDLHLVVAATVGLGMVHHDQGLLDEADRLYSAALALRGGASLGAEASFLLGYRALLEQERGRFGEAHSLHERAIAGFEKAGNRRFVGIFTGTLGGLLHEEGRLDEADRAYEDAIARCREVRDPRAEAMFLGCRAALLADRGDLEGAEPTLEAAEALMRDVRSPACREELLVHGGSLAAARARRASAAGDQEAAHGHLRAAEEVLARTREPLEGGPPPVARALMIRLAVRLLGAALSRSD